ILMFFWNNKYFLPESESKDISKSILAEQISNSLTNEIKSSYSLLTQIDILYNDKSLAGLKNVNIKNLKNKREISIGDYSRQEEIDDSLIQKFKDHFNVDSIDLSNRYWAFWMDATGKEIANWSFGNDPPTGNYKDRDYFK